MTNKPQDFMIDLSTRVALHSMLLQKLMADYIRRTQNPEQSLCALEKSLVDSFELNTLRPQPYENPAREEFAQAQSLYGRDLAKEFVQKIKKQI